ncbi:ABC transporter ATP-binding protein [Undibacterium sp. Tian12W]|uniref:ABC transporter ATP-binding protein n=1 Tax=Undibacterium sp. Tian12W TaxID=3413054 RepID=UPI003BF442A6
MSSKFSIKVEHLSKCYQLYDKPQDRLKQMLLSRSKTYYREFWALRDVSFEIAPGETVGIIGRNGSGKSSLLQMICGTLSPTTGTVTTYGRLAALLELGAGFNTEFTGRENVLLNAAILGFPQEQMLERMGEILAFSELGDFLDQPVKTYSSGMYARLAFSIAIHVDPEILIVDEALAVGDARFVAKCMRRIKDIQKTGASILFVSHDVSSVRTLCDRAIWLDKGRMLEQGDVFPVTGRYMEMMFQDDDAGDDGEHEAMHSANVPALGNVLTEVVVEDIALDSRPVTHWGSHKGFILSAAVLDASGARRDVHEWGKSMEIRISLRIPQSIDREHLSIAVSIKDLKGSDLIVSTTHDFETRRLPDDEEFEVSFTLTNPLVTGKYLLVAAVENRLHRDIHYYEYIEGAHYFSSLADQRFFGLFQPPISQEIVAPALDLKLKKLAA